MLPKIQIIQRKVSSKSSLELNSLQKSVSWCTCIFLQSGDSGLKRLIWLKYYYNEQKWQIIFTLGLNTMKNTDYMEKRFK